MQELNVFPDVNQLNIALSQAIVNELERLSKSGRKSLTIGISGGRTPLGLFSLLLEKHLDSPIWKQLEIFWVDERHVPFDDPESNYGNARSYLESLGIPLDQIHPMGANPDSSEAAIEYQELLTQSKARRPHGEALFDLTLLGLGPDGHVASLFPGTDHIQDTELCKAAIQPESGQARISLTLPALNSSNCCIFLASGSSKAEILSKVYHANPNPDLPATLIDPVNKPIWFIDEDAAQLIG